MDKAQESIPLQNHKILVANRGEIAMDKVRIVRHPQRICLRDILENVYDNFTEVGGQDEHSLDPSMECLKW